MVTLTRLQFYTTVTTQLDVRPPLFVCTLMVAVPTAKPRTTPALLTLATRVFELDHVTPTLDALGGETLASNLILAPRRMLSVPKFRPTLVTGVITDTVRVADLFPSTLVARMVVVPFRTAVIRPSASTVATAVEEDDQVRS